MDDLKSLFKAKGITYVQYQLTTIFGDLKTVSFPVQIWEDMADGAGVDGSSLNFLHTEQSDMIAVPDPNTFAVLPWESRVGRFICDLVDSDGNPHELDPRGILKKVLSQAREMNYELQTRPELEWYFLNPDFSPVDEGKYMDTKPFDPRESIRFDITDMMIAMGIGVKTIHHECGPGQNEIELSPANALSQCDGVQTAKLIAKTNAMFNGIICTFMPKPFLYQAGSGLHIHQYLTQDGENVFAGEGREISDTLRYFV
ncbi:MAG TPA: glutamine synthetase family protein, partial [Candidatus Lokiarchaeia archaeon]|nr:glutamine synthetase family protein [Candidatus Lokiarchaeia archaeon]